MPQRMIICNRCHHERPHHAAQICGPCYRRLRYEAALAAPKVCARCGGEYLSLRVEMCDKCKHLEAMKDRPPRRCRRCGEPVDRPKHQICAGCRLRRPYRGQPVRWQEKMGTTQRGYGHAYQQARRVLLADNPPCHWCGAPATTADHEPPLKVVGRPHLRLVPACRKCNIGRPALSILPPGFRGIWDA